MSLKLILNKLTSMVLVMCMLLSLAAPAVGEEPLTQPTEETVYSDGSTVYADGTVVYADGTIVYADGTTVHADGTTVNADGTTIYADGTTVYPDGKMVYADGTTVYPDGTTVYADGTAIYANGTIVYADGTTVHADGTTVNTDGTTVYPDGTTVYADGTMVYVNGTVAYPDGRVVYTDGTTLNPDGTTVYSDGTTVYADGTTVYSDGTTVYPDRTTVYPDGTTVYPDGTTVYPDGTTVYPDGTPVYPDDTTYSVLEEEQVPLAAPELYAADPVIETEGEYSEENTAVVTENPETNEQKTVDPLTTTDPASETQPVTDGEAAGGEAKTPPVIPGKEAELAEEAAKAEKTENTEKQESTGAAEPTDSEAEEESEENIEGQTEENPEETAGDPAEDTEDTTEENPEKTAEETTEDATEDATEDTAEDEPEETTENPAAPAEELPLRTLTVSAGQMAFRDQYLNPTEPVLWSGSIWNWLYGTAIEPAYTDGRVTVEISGHLPENVTARAMFIEFADPSAARNDERALMLLDVTLLDEGGAVYVPTEKLHVSVSSGTISGAAVSGEPFAAYFDDSYDGIGAAGDIKVRLDEGIDGSRLAYVPEQNEALRFWEAGGRLESTGNGTVEFDENRFPFRFVLSAQQEAREEEPAEIEQENVIKDVMLSGTLVASDGYTYEVSVSYPANCGIPVGAQLSVEELILGTDAYWDYINQSAAELGVSPADLSLARAFDISFVDPETGVHYQPTQDVQVSITLISTPVNTEEELAVLHFDDEAGQVQAMDVALNGEAIEFKTGSFSVFVVLQRVIEKTLTASDGNTYHITVDYDSASGIPDGVELNVSEIREGDPGYEEYIAQSAALVGADAGNLNFARAFDLTLGDPVTGTTYQPNKNVKVSIDLLDLQISDEATVDVLHFGQEVEPVHCALNGEAIEFAANGFSVYVVLGFTVDFHWGDYTWSIAGEESILLSELFEKLNVTEITLADVTGVSFSNPDYISVEQTDSDWLLRSLAPFDTEEKLTLTLSGGRSVQIKITDEQETGEEEPAEEAEVSAHNPKISISAGEYDAESKTVTYTVTVEAEGDMDYTLTTQPEGGEPVSQTITSAVVISDLTAESASGLSFVSGTYTYAHKAGFALADGASASQVYDTTVQENTAADFAGFPLTVSHMYDGDTITLTYTARVTGGNCADGMLKVANTATVKNENNSFNDQEDDTAAVETAFPYTALTRKMTGLEGSWATWQVTVNPEGFALNGSRPLTLTDTFDDRIETDARLSLDYSSVSVNSSSSVTYDYSGDTGTFTIPDSTAVTVSYRTRVTAEPGENATFRGTAVLKDSNGDSIAAATATVESVIYPSASDVAGFGTNYMMKLYVYGENQMQTGIGGAKFILMDSNKRPLEFKAGENKGEPVTFVTENNGYANIELHEENGDIAIEKNTTYYLEMIQAPAGYQKDNTLYQFTIKDNPDYNNYEYHNGDTMKVRLYAATADQLRVTIRFSGNYDLTEAQQDNVTAVLEKLVYDQGAQADVWEEVERHPNSDANWGAITFSTALEADETYRVVQENERPWDVPETIRHTSTYYCIIGAGESNPSDQAEFTLGQDPVEVTVVIDNRYEEPELILTKMDKTTGAKLAGAQFTVFKAKEGTQVKTYQTVDDGVVLIRGGDGFESEILYYVMETSAPEGYLLPLTPEKTYFYFCNDEYLIPEIMADLPEGETAVNLTENYDSLTIDNKKEKVTVPVMKTWQGNTWPEEVINVVIGLYQSVDGADPVAVLNDDDEPLTVTLTKNAPYNHTAFQNLPARNGDNKTITYSVKEESVNTDSGNIIGNYVQEYGVSDAGVYVVRNREATSLKVTKEWYDRNDNVKISETELPQQPEITFDVYRSSAAISEDVRADGITNGEMEAFVSGLEKVRTGLTLGNTENWTRTIYDLEKKDDNGDPYYYYVLETAPSFGDELYAVDETAGTVTIQNKVAPETVRLTLKKAGLVGDPREESQTRDFTFTLALNKGSHPISHPIRLYTVFNNDGTQLATDWNGQVSFTLKPETEILLTLPKGVTATVTEAYDPEYVVSAESDTLTDLDSDSGRVFRYEVTDDATITYTNTLHVICKVVDSNGDVKPYESLKSALAYIRNTPSAYVNGTATIQMLEDYTMTAADAEAFNLSTEENIRLTTAATNAADGFPFTTERTENTDTAIITRGDVGASMLTNAGTLTLDQIILDGANTAATTNGGLVSSSGTLNLGDGTILRNSTVSGKGGAVFATGTVNMTGGSITGNRATNGAAIYLDGAGATLTMTGGSITGNTGAADGAVVINNLAAKVNLSGAPEIYNNTNAQNQAANLYIGVDSDHVVEVQVPGLSAEARIGITATEGHREIGEQFASVAYEVEDKTTLSCFSNDTYGFRGKLKDGSGTNVVWDGLTLGVKKAVDPVGANLNDTFTITISSAMIKKSNYIINGTVNYEVTPARNNKRGTIVLNHVRHSDSITISPLPVGEYTVTEASSNYAPTYEGTNTETGAAVTIGGNGAFTLNSNSTVTVTNTRRLANVNLTKTLQDKLKTDTETQPFDFTVTLTEPDGTAVKGFTLAETVKTNDSGVAPFTMSPSNTAVATRAFRVPVGATVEITEVDASDYRITTSALTMPAEGEGQTIEDMDAADDVFKFSATDDGADITVNNARKAAVIELRKDLVGKVSKEEAFTIAVNLTRADGNPAANYTLYEDTGDPTGNITTNEDGQVIIPFRFGENESFKAVTLTIPEGTKLEVKETEVKKEVNGTEQAIYDTTYSRNGGTATTGTSLTIDSVKDTDTSIAFTNTRRTQTVTVTNTVGGYSGNVVPFTFTATVTDGEEKDYDDNGFTDGVQTFELATGQSKILTVPYGATLNVAESFIVGYDTTVKRGSAAAVTATEAVFSVTENETLAFTNTQLIGLQIVNNTTSTLRDVQIYVGFGTRMYRVNDAGDDQVQVSQTSDRWATISIEAGETAKLEINHKSGITDTQDYTVKGNAPATGYLYTINNEPSYHEYANPAIQRTYNNGNYEVKGQLRYSTSDSTVTFTEQPLVSFDANGGVWTTEMEDYHDRDGDRKVYQMAVNRNEKVARPTPDPVYPTAEGIAFLGWTTDGDYARADHSDGHIDSTKLYDFDNTPVTVPTMLYAVWAKPAREGHVVTVRNTTANTLNITATLTNNGAAVSSHTLFDDVTTGANGNATFTLGTGATQNLVIPEGAKLVLANNPDAQTVSVEFTDSDTVNNSFTIDSVTRDGTVTFTPGVCKITDDAGNILYDADGQPAVYTKLSDAFTAYNGTLYTSAEHITVGTQAAVKMLVDEYTIQRNATDNNDNVAINFPSATMTLTTAGKTDADFPYAGSRTRSTIYRFAGPQNSKSCFNVTGGNITLKDIILDGGSELGRKAEKQTNGGLIYMTGGALNITTGATLRNNANKDYGDGNWGRGGAIYLQGGTVNVNAGLFSNLHARRGGAIAATGGTLNITGTNGSTRFENCDSNGEDGGAIDFHVNAALTIDGGESKTNPGILFTGCKALTNAGDGGAIYADTSYNYVVTVKGCAFTECSAKVQVSGSTEGNGGGAISAWHVKGIDASYCSFYSCDTMTGGGAIAAYVKTSTTAGNKAVFVSYCTFDSCNCRAQGGAISAYQDDNGATASKTKLYINDSSFSDCSSGTNNSSGGAIQCYLPCMEFVGTSFSDCWAGKEGGAVNNFFGGNYTQQWANSSMVMTNCRFIRCRAEDRYDTTAVQHYGGGVNTKAKTVTVTGSYFEDCVSTLKEGGALHIGGQDAGSKATITGSTFKNCTAKNGGGALLSSHETLEINNCYFYGCSSAASNGGAVYNTANSRGGSTQKTFTITDCVFSADPEASDSEACSAVNGGSIWTRAQSVTIKDCTINGSVAGGNGGAICLSKNGSQSATITDSEIKNSRAVKGSAVYVDDTATFSGVSITGNTCSDINSGAIQGGKLYFEGNTVVKGNPCSSDEKYMHDVLMQNNNETTLYATENGLGGNADIGVYVPDSQFNNRGTEGKAFGTWAKENDLLESFFNDRDDGLFGYQASSTDKKIYWGRYLCKITDADGNTLKRANGRDAVYAKLTTALEEFTVVKDENGETGKAKYIKMLVENYNIQQEAQISNFPGADITLTTAGSDDENHPYRGTEGTVCTISRTNSTNQLFYLNNADATFQLENITLDGRKDKTAETGNFRLIQANAGTIVLNSGTTMQNALRGIYAENDNVKVTINGHYDTENEKATVQFLNCIVTNGNGGAIVARKLKITSNTETEGQYGTEFANCTATGNGGAVYVNGIQAEMSGVLFKDCHCNSSAGAFYHDKSDATLTTVIDNCAFEDCYARDSHAGAMYTKAGTLSVNNSNFLNCYAPLNGGAIHHDNKVKTEISNTTFIGCKTTGTATDKCYGGSIYTNAASVGIVDGAFTNSTSFNHGGALYCANTGAVTTILGTEFDRCSVNRDVGCGGAIYSKGKTLTLKGDTIINNCIAPAYSGAVYMETNQSILNITDNTQISSCYANQGGAIYLKSKVTMKLTDSPEFTGNGYTTQNGAVINAEKGACIYLEQGSSLDLSGRPKFSRNNITSTGTNSRDRITNGGITDYVRQDIYLAGYGGADAESIHISGELTVDTIWVWPEHTRHDGHNEQFAMTAESVSAESLNMFRNALSDGATGCSNGEFLAGVRLPGYPVTKVYWDKMYNISFKKIDNKAIAVPDAVFTLYRDYDCTQQVAIAESADGETDKDSWGNLQDRGIVDFASIPIGVYYMKETQAPESFLENEKTYIVMVGTPVLSPPEDPSSSLNALWKGGPLDVPNAATLVARYTTNAGKYFGIFELGADGKADLSKNLASANAGIINTRNDYEAYFMKVDSSGAELPGAEFTIYTPVSVDDGNPAIYEETGYPKLKLWSRDGTEDTRPEPVKSADGTSANMMLDGNNVPKGLVYFRELPMGTYYLLETGYPERNGSNRRTFYVETDRVLKLEIKGLEGFTLSELQEDGTYQPCKKNSFKDVEYYTVANTEAVCKLTDGSDNLLYELGRDGETLLPAIYSTLEAGFAAAQTQTLYRADGSVISEDDALKLKALKDFTVSEPIDYTSSHPLTFTTAETSAKKDRYVFTTNRAADAARAEIRWNGTSASAQNAMITVNTDAGMTLENIKLDGQKSAATTAPVRAVNVVKGSLSIGEKAAMQNFSTDGNGGAVLMNNGTTITIDGGRYRTAEFTGNVSANGAGGALALGRGCEISIQNVRFTGNQAATDGGAISFADQPEQLQDSLTITNAVFTSNTASGDGGAVFIGEKVNMTFNSSTFSSNIAAKDGGAVYIDENVTMTFRNSTFTSNRAADEGGAVYVESGSFMTVRGTTIRSNSANQGSAVYGDSTDAEENDGAQITISGGTITGNSASDVNGGAINVGGLNSRIYFEGNPIVYENYDLEKKQQKNMVLSRDSNGIIRTAESGLGTEAKIGVYVIDSDPADGELLSKHGQATNPFGTFDDSERLNPAAFRNDRNAELYGVKKDDDPETRMTIFWSGVAGSRRVVLRKVVEAGESFLPVNNAQFAVYTDRDGNNVAEGIVRTDEGKEEKVKLDKLTSGASGILWIGDLPYGTYYLKESSPDKVFVLTVDENGVGYLRAQGEQKNYSNQLPAEP